MFSGVFARRPSVESGEHLCLDMLGTSSIHEAFHHLRDQAWQCSRGRWQWRDTGFHLSVADGEAGTAGTLVGYEELALFTRQVVPIAGGDRCQ